MAQPGASEVQSLSPTPSSSAPGDPAQSWRSKLPDRPLLLSGAFGGPAVIYLCTPLRNGLTLGSRDKRSNSRLLYRKVFRGGFQAGWIGGAAPAAIACPQFLALGPVYHFLHASLESTLKAPSGSLHFSVLASLGAALCETFLTFGSQSRNAQMAYNNSFVTFASVVDGSRKHAPLNKVYDIWGPGAGAMLIRNFVSVLSVRSFSPWLRDHLPGDGLLSANTRATLCDASAAMAASAVSAPVHQLFNFLATTPEARNVSKLERAKMARRFLREQYFVPLPREASQELLEVDFSKPMPEQQYSWRLSRVALRDFGMRTAYVTSVFTLFISLERTLCSMMR
eukprot:TRINITY_DN67265_c0_g1_i1.p1 TRINITY_DN67265_c0_g1~~TRINITY_DN67265_c0_g1_i1.p1  ORF type:complete len:339 (+),score=57.39 TRINITY_DN67265_c0_g1_i1:53-1069(+)